MKKYLYIQIDVRNAGDTQAKIAKALGENNLKIDCMLNTPAFNAHKLFAETSFDEIELTYDIKLLGYTNLIKSTIDFFAPNCSVVNVGSVHGQRTNETNSVYAAANAGVEALTRALTIEYRHKFRFNTISPGGILTERYKETHPDQWSEKLKNGQKLLKEDIVNVIVFLFDEKSKGINGENIIVDGGISALRGSSSSW